MKNGIKSFVMLLTIGTVLCSYMEVAASEATEIEETVTEEQTDVFVEGYVWLNGKAVYNTETQLDMNKSHIENFDQYVEELAQFPFLTRVELCDSNLSNQQMEVLMAQYPKIKFVWKIKLGGYWTLRTDQVAFSCNKGPGPELCDWDVDVLKYCTDMVALDLGHNIFTNVDFVKYMPNLRVLIVSTNWAMKDISALKYCPNLVYFECWTSGITDLSSLQYLVNLKDLNLSHTICLKEVGPLKHLPRLERFYFTGSAIPRACRSVLKSWHPNTLINWTAEKADDDGWRTHPRYYAMRKMYFSNTVAKEFLDDYDRLGYFAKVFNYDYYVANYPEVVEALGTDPITLLYYYLNEGVYEGQQACETFSVADYYTLMQPALYSVCGDDLGAYMRYYLYDGDL